MTISVRATKELRSRGVNIQDRGERQRDVLGDLEIKENEIYRWWIVWGESWLFNHLFSLVAQRLKRQPPMRETRVRSLGQEDPLEKEMAIHSSILAWRIPWTEKPSRLQSTGSQRVGHD